MLKMVNFARIFQNQLLHNGSLDLNEILYVNYQQGVLIKVVHWQALFTKGPFYRYNYKNGGLHALNRKLEGFRSQGQNGHMT